MFEHLIVEGIQTDINAASLGMIGDGETLEKSIECLRNSKNSPTELPSIQNVLEHKAGISIRAL